MKNLKMLNLVFAIFFFIGNLDSHALENSLESPIVDSPQLAHVETLVLSNNELGLDLYARIKKEDQNLVFSPYSVATALQMVYAGAAGVTQSQMSRILHFSLSSSDLEKAVTTLTHGLVSQNKNIEEDFFLNTANGLWIQEGHPILPAFEKSMTTAYQGIVKSADFQNKSESVRFDINDWVKAQTQGKIVDLLSPSTVSSTTRLILVNALYMHAKWQTAFDSSLTRSMPFFPHPAKTLTVPMMFSAAEYGFQREKDFSIVELSYAIEQVSPKVSMYIILPHDTFGLYDVERDLNSEKLLGLMRGLKKTHLALSIPKFQITSTIKVKELLEKMGLTEPFSSTANFSEIDGTTDLQITDVLQKAFIAIDETGTEAGAATAVGVGLKSVLVESPENVVVDHPFLFFVVDKQTGTFLFIGRIVLPS